MTLDLTPAPGAASSSRTWAAQTRMELSLLLKNGEQLLLTIIIPLVLLVALSALNLLDAPDPAVNSALPGVIGVAILATAFTSTAIATGFDRRSGVLKFLGSTPLSRTTLVSAKVTAVLIVEALQIALLLAVALALGWQPPSSPGQLVWLALLVLLGTTALGALGVAVAGVLRAEATLALANGIFLLLLVAGGTAFPLGSLPDPMAAAVRILPTGALGEGLRAVMLEGTAPPAWTLVVLALWALAGSVVVARTFKWE